MKSLKLSPQQSKNILSNLPPGTVSIISKKSGLSHRMIYYILKGKYSDKHGIIKMTSKQILKHKHNRNKLSQTLKQL